MSHKSVSFTDTFVKFGTHVQGRTLDWLVKYDPDRIRIPDFMTDWKSVRSTWEIPFKNSYMLYLCVQWSDSSENGQGYTHWHCLQHCQIWSRSDPDCGFTDWSNFWIGQSHSNKACLFVRLLALYSLEFCTFCDQIVSAQRWDPEQGTAKLWPQKVKGQGQGHWKGRKHFIGYNFGFNCRRHLMLGPYGRVTQGPSYAALILTFDLNLEKFGQGHNFDENQSFFNLVE